MQKAKEPEDVIIDKCQKFFGKSRDKIKKGCDDAK